VKKLVGGSLGGGGTGNMWRRWCSVPWSKGRRRPMKMGHCCARRPTGLTAVAEIKRIMEVGY
jgi:hypothetical protein